ncbi:MAG: hypothetical protein WD757_05745 [Actinomycetota bacterium]
MRTISKSFPYTSGSSSRISPGEPFSQRFKATFSDDGSTITGRWEIAEDGTGCTPDFDLVPRKANT